VGSWYWIGTAVGLGAAAGVLLAGLVSGSRAALVGAVTLGAAAGAGVGYGIDAWQPGSWGDIVGGALGAVGGGLGAAQVVSGALRRGGTRGGTAVLVAGAALATAGLAWVPVLGYLEALVLPGLAARIRRRAPERYAGLRTLARD
jgi:hypothetical protein